MKREPILGIRRLRMGSDGHGIRTLVAFNGCNLRCKYCLNPRCLRPATESMFMSPEEVVDEIKKDELYYIATNGGVTFGGGEPLKRSDFIVEVIKLGDKKWNIAVETSLFVGRRDIEIVLPYVDEFIIDIKDMNPDIYKQYTDYDNKIVKRNIGLLVDSGASDKIICRIPLIRGFNDEVAQLQSIDELMEMGIRRFDIFTYKVLWT